MVWRLFTAVVALCLFVPSAQAQFRISNIDEVEYLIFRTTRQDAIRRMDRALERELVRLGEVAGGLTDGQRFRLQLAGMADRQQVLADFDSFKRSLRSDEPVALQVNSRLEEVGDLRARAEQVFKAKSVLQKSLSSVLTADQMARVEAAADQLRNDLYEYAVRRTMMNARPSTVFPPEFQKAMSEAILAETNPPRNPDDSLKYQQQITCYKLAQIPEEKLRPLCDGQQWESIQQMRTNGVQYAEMLRNADVFGDDE
ncbi:MAG: hypothetical protein R3C18_27455 [Planctomycetaceae bacterium]